MTREGHPEVPQAVLQAAHLYLNAWLDEADARRDKGDKKRGPYHTLVTWCMNFGDQDDSGSRTLLFPQPVTIDGTAYTGIRFQAKQPAPYWDEDAAKALIDAQGPEVTAAATHTEVIYDYDYLYLLVQQGKMKPEQLDTAVITPPKTYSLTVLEAKAS